MPSLFVNPNRGGKIEAVRPTREPMKFHRRTFGEEYTPLVSLPRSAKDFRVASFHVKDESTRYGLPAFKILGASWGMFNSLIERFPDLERRWSSLEEARRALESVKNVSVVAASEGNHGRAVARMAKLLGLNARIVLPRHCSETRRRAIEGEGAHVEIFDGGYDESVARAFSLAGKGALVVQDASIPGHDSASQFVVEGYSTMLWEIDDVLSSELLPNPTHVFVQIGVGSLADAVVRHFRSLPQAAQPYIVGVEPISAACACEAVRHGHVVSISTTPDSSMVGLNCRTMSTYSYHTLSTGIDAFIQIEDRFSQAAQRMLEENGVHAGVTGAAGMGAVIAVCSEESRELNRQPLGLHEDSRILTFVTEGETS